MHSVLTRLKAVTNTNLRPDADLIRFATEVLERVPPEHRIVVGTIRELLATVR
jgi:hypothetical protein